MATITFDGTEKCIIITFANGETEVTLDIKSDLYSRWKEWAVTSDNTKYLEAMTAIGGQPKGGSKFVGSTFFIINDWVLCPILSENGSSTLSIVGELLSEDGIKSIIDFSQINTGQNLNFIKDIPISSEIQIVETNQSGLTALESNTLFSLDTQIKNLQALIISRNT